MTSCRNSTRSRKVFNFFNCLRTRTRIPFFDFFHNEWIEDYSISIRHLPPIESILSLSVERVLWHLYCCPISTIPPHYALINKGSSDETSFFSKAPCYFRYCLSVLVSVSAGISRPDKACMGFKYRVRFSWIQSLLWDQLQILFKFSRCWESNKLYIDWSYSGTDLLCSRHCLQHVWGRERLFKRGERGRIGARTSKPITSSRYSTRPYSRTGSGARTSSYACPRADTITLTITYSRTHSNTDSFANSKWRFAR